MSAHPCLPSTRSYVTNVLAEDVTFNVVQPLLAFDMSATPLLSKASRKGLQTYLDVTFNAVQHNPCLPLICLQPPFARLFFPALPQRHTPPLSFLLSRNATPQPHPLARRFGVWGLGLSARRKAHA
jgi:hypothetical protein